jgi:hypothetical protein
MEQSHREKKQEKRIKHLESVIAGLQAQMKANDLLARVEKLEAK